MGNHLFYFGIIKSFCALLFCCSVINGCCSWDDTITGEAPDEIVSTFEPEISFSTDAAVNRNITTLTIKFITLYGGRAPIVTRDFVETDEEYNSLPQQVFHSLRKSNSIKPYYKGISAEAELTLKSRINSKSGSTIWILELLNSNNDSLWQQELLLEN